jgi:plasmid stability protein
MTIRKIPDAVEKGIRLRARKAGRSMNSATIELIEEALGLRGTEKKKRDLSGISGQWSAVEFTDFEAHTRQFEQTVWNPGGPTNATRHTDSYQRSLDCLRCS